MKIYNFKAKIVNSGNTASRNLGKKQVNLCALWSVLLSTPWTVAPVPWTVLTTPWTVEWDVGRRALCRGILDVGLGGLCKEIAQKVAKTAKKVKEKKAPSLAHRAVGQQDKPKSEGEGQLWALVRASGAKGGLAL